MHIPKITGPKTRVGILATAGMVLLATAPNIAKAQKQIHLKEQQNWSRLILWHFLAPKVVIVRNFWQMPQVRK